MASIKTAKGYLQSAASQEMRGGCLLRLPHFVKLILSFECTLREDGF